MAMPKFFTLTLFCCFGAVLVLNAQQQQSLTAKGLEKSVEIITDKWGIPHIYAQTEADLFFAQGFYAAKDRLFQFEIWRRQATGTVAELLGPRELKRDIGTRLFRFRGDMIREMNHYHDRGELIITSFVKGVNAYIELTEERPDLLPIEFKLLGMKPQKWTPEVVISRHQGLLGNIGQELAIGRAVALLGTEKVKELSWFHPNEPDLTLDKRIKKESLFKDILELYRAYRRPVTFQPEDLIAMARTPDLENYRYLAAKDLRTLVEQEKSTLWDIGSNNWVISGAHTQSGFPIMANDPHRTQATPSLRYMAHLIGPGWNVIGGGEPEIPGISIGHNEYGAWGLTVFRTDAEDLYAYEINPDDHHQYKYKGTWENMRVIDEIIPVKGQDSVKVALKYTRHGPVVFEDRENQLAYAVRCGWQEIGGSPYLASLRMNQAKNFAEFREACHYSNIPGENMIWADRAGNIGWQAVGIAPVRRNWSGLVPVPGDGSYEWDGYLPIKAKPHLYNPPSGIFGTSNENVVPEGYPYTEAIGFSWSDPYRGDRVMEVLSSGRQHSLIDMARLQTDYLSIPAREFTQLLKPIKVKGEDLVTAKKYLMQWDQKMEPNSIAAGIYNAWERQIRDNMKVKMIPENAQAYLSLQLKKIIDWLLFPDGKFGDDPVQGRNAFLVQALQEAVDKLKKRLGNDMTKWQYGQTAYKHILIKHSLSNAVKEDIREKIDVGPVPRGGNSYTVNNTSSNDNQRSGASFRLIVDTGNWDHTLGTNTPGQSGNPNHPHYRNLFDIWASDQFFPVFYSREKVESVEESRMMLTPK